MNTKEKRFSMYVDGSVFFTQKLNELGLSTKYTGYFYLANILDVIINGELKVKSFSRQVYPIVAKNFGTSVCTIERNIRSLIKNCWNKEISQRLCVNNVKRPTCCRFITLIAKRIVENIS